MSGIELEAQFEEAEIRRAAPDIDNQRVLRPGITTTEPLPQLMRSVVPFQPAIERSLRLFQQPHAVGEARFLSSGNR